MVRLTLAALREARRTGDFARTVRRLGHLLRDVRRSERAGEAYLRVLRYLFTVSGEGDPAEMLQALADELGEEGRDEAMGFLDSLEERARKEGEAMGRAEGVRRALERQLVRKFGALTDETRAWLDGLTAAGLEDAIDRIVTASRLEDVVG